MSSPQPTMDNPLAGGIKPFLITVLRMLVSTCVIFICYYELPVQSEQGKSDLPYLILHVAVFAVVVVVQVPVIVRSRHPMLRAVESTVLTILIYLTLFARIYLSAASTDPAAFTETMTKTRSLYFTVTVFTTVGFGDIVARIDPSRVLVLIQMLLNLVVLGVVIKVLFTAGTRGMERKRTGDSRRWFATFIPLSNRPSGARPNPPDPATDPPPRR